MLKKNSGILAIVAFCAVMIVLSAGCSREEFGGLGIEVPSGEGKVTKDTPYEIVRVYKGGTGELAGLQPGDKIISVDGQPLKGMQYDFIVKDLLRGKPGSIVTLEIERKNEIMIFRVLRGKIVLKD